MSTTTATSNVTFPCTSAAAEDASSSMTTNMTTTLTLRAEITDLQKPTKPLLTGVGFLDHMLDQFNSHAQIGVSVVIVAGSKEDDDLTFELDHGNRNRLAQERLDQTTIFHQVGTVLGKQFDRIMTEKQVKKSSTSFFGCPLDEALVLVTLERTNNNDGAGAGSLEEYNLAPYGSFPPTTGRSHLGHMELKPLLEFWTQIAKHAKLNVKFQKLRGDNAHHIVEAAFKAFSRAIRNLIDGVDTNTIDGDDDDASSSSRLLAQLYGPESANAKASLALNRSGTVTRKTKETSIECILKLDNGGLDTNVSTGLPGMDTFWTRVSQEAHVSLQASCQGDLWIDEHHTVEDVAIALGQVWNQALGDKAGLNRMWCCTCVQGTARVLVVLDLSNRPMLTHNLPLSTHKTEHLDHVPVEMLEHVLDSFVVNARMTLHIVVTSSSSDADGSGSGSGSATLEDTWNGLAIALGRALRYGILVDQRRAGATASSKGTLSV